MRLTLSSSNRLRVGTTRGVVDGGGRRPRASFYEMIRFVYTLHVGLHL